MEPEHSFCDFCQNLLDPGTWPQPSGVITPQHHSSVQELYSSAVSGCRFCVTILQMGWGTCGVSGRLAELDPALHHRPDDSPSLGEEHDPTWPKNGTYLLQLSAGKPEDLLSLGPIIAQILMLRWVDVHPEPDLIRYGISIGTFTKLPPSSNNAYYAFDCHGTMTSVSSIYGTNSEPRDRSSHSIS